MQNCCYLVDVVRAQSGAPVTVHVLPANGHTRGSCAQLAVHYVKRAVAAFPTHACSAQHRSHTVYEQRAVVEYSICEAVKIDIITQYFESCL
jgi:hypothetical protein